MRLILILLLLQCMVIRRTNLLPDYPSPTKAESPINAPVLVILNREVYDNGLKRNSIQNRETFINQLQYGGLFSNIENNLEKVELIIEIEIETRKKSYKALPYITALTLTLVPFYEDYEITEKLRILKKTGEIVFQTSRIQKLDYWFGLLFTINGFIQQAKPERENNLSFEKELIEKMHRDIIEELSLKKF